MRETSEVRPLFFVLAVFLVLSVLAPHVADLIKYSPTNAKAGVTVMRGGVLALSDGSNPVAFAFQIRRNMLAKKRLEIYVDESGNFGDTRDSSRYCMITLVLHDADSDFSDDIRNYSDGIFNLGADPDTMSFHTAPLIRQEDQFSAMSRNMRGKIFYRMLSLVRKIDVRYKSISVDTDFVVTEVQIVSNLQNQLREFLDSVRVPLAALASVHLYYDAGQKGVTRILETLIGECPCRVEVEQGVRQKDHILLQIADFLCTLSLIEKRLEEGLPFNHSEKKFFGSPRDFKRNVLRKIKPKELV